MCRPLIPTPPDANEQQTIEKHQRRIILLASALQHTKSQRDIWLGESMDEQPHEHLTIDEQDQRAQEHAEHLDLQIDTHNRAVKSLHDFHAHFTDARKIIDRLASQSEERKDEHHCSFKLAAQDVLHKLEKSIHAIQEAHRLVSILKSLQRHKPPVPTKKVQRSFAELEELSQEFMDFLLENKKRRTQQ